VTGELALKSAMRKSAGELSSHFDVDVCALYNVINIDHYTVNLFENNFCLCCEIKLLNSEQTCQCIRRKWKVSHDRRQYYSMPVVFQ